MARLRRRGATVTIYNCRIIAAGRGGCPGDISPARLDRVDADPLQPQLADAPVAVRTAPVPLAVMPVALERAAVVGVIDPVVHSPHAGRVRVVDDADLGHVPVVHADRGRQPLA